jgi:hypothetical protein
MSTVRITTRKTVVRVSKTLNGERQATVIVRSTPAAIVRVSLNGYAPLSELRTSAVFYFNGGSGVVIPGQAFTIPQIPFACRVIGWAVEAEPAGSVVLDVLKASPIRTTSMKTCRIGTRISR